MMSGDRIVRIEAILSGTISYIFNNFTGDASFYDVVKTAPELGYTEPDPRDDLKGTDFLRKLLTLARHARHALHPHAAPLRPPFPHATINPAPLDHAPHHPTPPPP